MNRKEKIIESALYLFARHGYSETSIDKIAQHAQVSKGLTYTHFKSKEDLLQAVIRNSITKMTGEMMEIKEMNIGKLFTNFFASLRRNKEVIQLCLLLLTHPETPSSVSQLLESQKQELLQLLSLLLKERDKDNCEMEARTLLATLDGITLDYVVQPDDENLSAIEQYLITKYTSIP